MKVYIFSKGETTTELAKWSYERFGYEVEVIFDLKTSFHQKYLEFLNKARNDEICIRTDADIIANKRVEEFVAEFMGQKEIWWATPKGFCFLKNDLIDMSINVMNNKVIQLGLQHMHKFRHELRPETKLSRVQELMTPRRFLATTKFCGTHGFKQSELDVERVLNMKEARGQINQWDWPLIKRMQDL